MLLFETEELAKRYREIIAGEDWSVAEICEEEFTALVDDPSDSFMLVIAIEAGQISRQQLIVFASANLRSTDINVIVSIQG